MLAAQCSKLSSKSPPPLADAAVGKGFHPWKKSGGNNTSASSTTATATSGNNTLATSSASTGGLNNNNNNNNNNGQFNGVTQNGQSGQRQASATTTNTNTSSVTSLGAATATGLGMAGYHQRPGMGATAAGSYGGDLYFSHPHQAPDMYSRTAHHPYEQAWQFQQHVKQEAAAGVNGSSWWDMHQAAAAGGWLDMSGATVNMPSAHHTASAMHAAAAAAAASAAYSASDYSASLAAAGSTAHLLSTGQHLLQDTYKSMQQHHSSVTTSPFGVGLGSTGHQPTAASVSSAATSAHQVKTIIILIINCPVYVSSVRSF